MIRIVTLIAIITLIWAKPMTALADWVEAQSDNFIFWGDVSEKRATKIVSELEEYRAIIFTLFKVEASPEVIPVRVYATKSARDVTAMTGMEGASGVYSTRLESPLFILNVKGGFTDKSQAKAIALHEYTHHLLSQYTNQMYPRWVNEGMAEYLSTFRASKNGYVRIGLPIEGRAWTLNNYDWLDWSILTRAIRRYPYPNDGSRNTEAIQRLFYAQSWLAVHYIQSNPELAEKLSQYVRGVPQAKDPTAYFTQVFGMSPTDFGTKLERYFKRNSFPGRQVTLPEGFGDVDIRIRKLNDGEADFHRGEAVRQFRSQSQDGREKAEAYFADAEADQGPMAQIEASRALLAIAAEDPADARAHIDRAMSLAGTDGRVLHVAAKVAVAEYLDKSTTSTSADMEAARALFMKALRANPDNMEAHYDYVSTYHETGDRPSKQAISSAKECTYYYRSANFMGSNMALVPILENADNSEFARHHLQRAALWAPTARMRRIAMERLERLDGR